MDNSFFGNSKLPLEALSGAANFQLIDLGPNPFRAAAIAYIELFSVNQTDEIARKLLHLYNPYFGLDLDKKNFLKQSTKGAVEQLLFLLKYSSLPDLIEKISFVLQKSVVDEFYKNIFLYSKISSKFPQDFDPKFLRKPITEIFCIPPEMLFILEDILKIDVIFNITENDKELWKREGQVKHKYRLELWLQNSHYYLPASQQVTHLASIKQKKLELPQLPIESKESWDKISDLNNQAYKKIDTLYHINRLNLREMVHTGKISYPLFLNLYIQLLPDNKKFGYEPPLSKSKTIKSNLDSFIDVFALWQAVDPLNKEKFYRTLEVLSIQPNKLAHKNVKIL